MPRAGKKGHELKEEVASNIYNHARSDVIISDKLPPFSYFKTKYKPIIIIIR